MNGAAGSNVAGSLGSLAQSAAINVLQSLAVNQVRDIADSLRTRTPNGNNSVTYTQNTASEGVRAALQALVGCAGSAASGSGSCSSAAAGAAASVVLNALINDLTGRASETDDPRTQRRDADGHVVNPLTLEEQQSRSNLIATLVAGITAATGGNINAAVTAAQIETENNDAGTPGQPNRIVGQPCVDIYRLFCRSLNVTYTTTTAIGILALQAANGDIATYEICILGNSSSDTCTAVRQRYDQITSAFGNRLRGLTASEAEDFVNSNTIIDRLFANDGDRLRVSEALASGRITLADLQTIARDREQEDAAASFFNIFREAFPGVLGPPVGLADRNPRPGESEYVYRLRLAALQGDQSVIAFDDYNCRNDVSAFCNRIRTTPLNELGTSAAARDRIMELAALAIVNANSANGESEAGPTPEEERRRLIESGQAVTAAAGAPMGPDGPDDETDEQRFERLNTRDIGGNGRFRPDEARAAADFERQFGARLERSSNPGEGDFVVTRGNSLFTEGARIEIKFTARNAVQQNLMNREIMRNPGNPANGYQGTLNRVFEQLRRNDFDYIAINTRQLTSESLSRITQYINQQPANIISRIRYIR